MVELHVFLAGASGRARNPIICDGLMVHHQSMRARLCHRRPFRICTSTSQGMTLVALLTLSLLTRSWRGFLPKLFLPGHNRKRGTNCFFDLQTVFLFTEKKIANSGAQFGLLRCKHTSLHIYSERKSYFAGSQYAWGAREGRETQIPLELTPPSRQSWESICVTFKNAPCGSGSWRSLACSVRKREARRLCVAYVLYLE
jgi:hypothetical protein